MSGKDKREKYTRDFRTEFSILLTSLREKRYKQRTWGKDWTQLGVANRLGVSRGMYNQWENGRAVPTRSDLKNIVSDFGLDEKEEFTLYRTSSQAPPEIENLPFKSNPFFTGREHQLEQLFQLLMDNDRLRPRNLSLSAAYLVVARRNWLLSMLTALTRTCTVRCCG